MVTVTSAEFQKQFGRFRELAQREPVAITNHGRESLVLISADEFKRLKELDTRRAYYAWELPDDLAQALDTAAAPDWTARFDREIEP
ncbi:MAG: type II toxin-antitoxin system Phd/YefM family antitoxin [Alphaproteobacteria bacterium]|nr:type II toxin-antitoxin system Phd/YefM family antitoxin [Alphaproteobacteria bacterium]